MKRVYFTPSPVTSIAHLIFRSRRSKVAALFLFGVVGLVALVFAVGMGVE